MTVVAFVAHRPAAAGAPTRPDTAASRSVDLPAPAGPDVWLVSSRRLGGIGCLPTAARFDIQRHVGARGCGRWETSDLAACLGETDRPLVVFVHGNRYDLASARSQGLGLAGRLEHHCPAAGPARTVIFSWPSSQEGILLRDGRAKYDRAKTDGHYLARLLADVPPERPVALVGYSYGALIVLEALEDLVAAERSGRGDVQPWIGRPGRTHVVFVAPAARCDAFAPAGPYRETLSCIDRISLVINSSDHALRFFPWVERNSRADALGVTGMPRRWLPAEVEFEATDAAAIIGRQHGLPLYLASPTLAARLAAGALRDIDR